MPIDLGRRNWLRGLLPKAVDTVTSVVSQALPQHLRPPGAADEASFLAACTRCGDCVRACEPLAIFTLTEGVANGTPVLSPSERPCLMCDGFPCATACTTTALTVPIAGTVRLGSVQLLTRQCFTFRGPECGACGGLCPGELRAITFRGTRPAVDTEACVGCGRCVEACPTAPKALVFEELTWAERLAHRTAGKSTM